MRKAVLEVISLCAEMPANPDDSLESLEMDSLDLMFLLVRIEAEFSLPEIPPLAVAAFKTAGDICDYVEAHGR